MLQTSLKSGTMSELENEKKNYYKRLGQLSVVLYLLGVHESHYVTVATNQNTHLLDVEALFQLDVALLKISDESKTEGKNDDIQINLTTENDVQLNRISCFAEFKQGMNIMSDFILDNKKDISLKIKEYFTPDIKVKQYLKEAGHYHHLMQFINHPSYLKDMFYLEKLLDNSLAYPYQDKRVCTFEIDSMRQGHMPNFYTELGSRDVITSSDERIPDYFDQKPLDQVVNKIERFDIAEMEKQVNSVMTHLHKFEETDEVLE